MPRFDALFGSSLLALLFAGAAVADDVPEWSGYLDAAERADTRQRHSVNTRIGADAFYRKGIYGQGTKTASIEAGQLWNGHVLFSSVSDGQLYAGVQAEPKHASAHATGVCAALAGGSVENPRTMGIAPQADLFSASFFRTPQNASDPPFTHTSLLTTYRRFFGKVDVINTSWGTVWPHSTVEFYSYLIDALCREHPETLFVAAAGNTGNLPDAALRGKVSTIASGFNNIAVGAQGNAPAYDELYPNSCSLPVDFINPRTGKREGQRAGVDVTAPGEMIVVPTINPKDPGRNDLFFKASGTSVAAPVVAGGACLLVSEARAESRPAKDTDARLLKAVLLNSADKPADWGNGSRETAYRGHDRVQLTTQGLDYKYGAGFLNLARAQQQHRAAVPGTPARWLLETMRQGQSRTVSLGTVPAGATVTATLVWFQDCTIRGFRQAPDDAALTRMLKEGKQSPLDKPELDYTGMADFNLELWKGHSGDPGQSVLTAASATPNNTVEHLRWKAEEAGDYYLKITFDRMTYGDAPAQGESCAAAWDVAAPAGSH